MKLSKKFLEDLHKIGEWAFVEKNMWIGKLVPDIIVDNLQKRGINQEDIEGCVCLTLNQAKELALKLMSNADFFFLQTGEFDHDTDAWWLYLTDKIEQAEKCERKIPDECIPKAKVWHTFDETPPEGKTFLIRQDHHKVYFGRIVQGRILTCFVFQNLNGLTNGAIVESGKPLGDWVKAQKPRAPNDNTELVWAGFDWQAEKCDDSN